MLYGLPHTAVIVSIKKLKFLTFSIFKKFQREIFEMLWKSRMDDDIAYYEQLQAEQEEYEVWVSDRLWPKREIMTKISLFYT